GPPTGRQAGWIHCTGADASRRGFMTAIDVIKRRLKEERRDASGLPLGAQHQNAGPLQQPTKARGHLRRRAPGRITLPRQVILKPHLFLRTETLIRTPVVPRPAVWPRFGGPLPCIRQRLLLRPPMRSHHVVAYARLLRSELHSSGGPQPVSGRVCRRRRFRSNSSRVFVSNTCSQRKTRPNAGRVLRASRCPADPAFTPGSGTPGFTPRRGEGVRPALSSCSGKEREGPYFYRSLL